MTISLKLTRPDDWHLHVRDGEFMAAVVPHSALRFGRAVIMPNLVPPVSDTASALAYRERILKHSGTTGFDPMMALYLTPTTSKAHIRDAAAEDKVIGVKWYPTGATTHSSHGVSDINDSMAVLEAMCEFDVPLLVHGEVTDPEVDTFDREARFIDNTLEPLLNRLPTLRVVLEHITTVNGADYVANKDATIGATITPQHLLLNRTALFQGGLRPHNFCLPVLKREHHRQRLVEVATSGNPRFFLGTDSAPHSQHAKESACGCAGVYSAHAGIELYAEVFEQADALDKLEGFASHHGADFYGLPRNTDTIELHRTPWQVPTAYPAGKEFLIPFRAGETINWSFKASSGRSGDGGE